MNKYLNTVIDHNNLFIYNVIFYLFNDIFIELT